MAVTKTITKCVPYVNSSSKVDKWDITMKYENGSPLFLSQIGRAHV